MNEKTIINTLEPIKNIGNPVKIYTDLKKMDYEFKAGALMTTLNAGSNLVATIADYRVKVKEIKRDNHLAEFAHAERMAEIKGNIKNAKKRHKVRVEIADKLANMAMAGVSVDVLYAYVDAMNKLEE